MLNVFKIGFLRNNAYKLNWCTLRRFSDWHLVGALCLERRPIITQERTPLEERYFQYLYRKEVEKSFLSDHEKRHLDDLRNAEKMKKGEIEDIDTVSKQTAQDFEDASIEELNKFPPHPRTTDADEENNQQSIQRKLDSSLLLVIKQKIGNDLRWILPQTVHQKGETLCETAVRAFNEICTNPVKLQIMGNAPVGFYKYKYPKAIRQDGVCGAKVFFFKAQLLDNRLQTLNIQSDTVVDHRWLTHSEIKTVLQPVYEKVVQSFLYPDAVKVEDTETKSLLDEEEHIIKSSASN
ncbi:large ribosomal subunit protein mL46 isoform X2 [Parasteatoda tepidariorum]|uniref:large ribosomal subunit protein mL46 isoform X2 n=1 Tax=Parasteatoda tepidariorum TaxID=114398 RepID=UPI00077FA558|nr:39S ribosomal protein L46, mitochondrial isoform X2 [Parasteatoda tepidariorum]